MNWEYFLSFKAQVSSQCSGWSQGSRQHHGTTRPGAIRNSNTQSATLLNTIRNFKTLPTQSSHLSLLRGVYDFVFPSAFTSPALQRPAQMIPELHECMEINYNKRIIGLEAESTTIP